MMFVKRLLNFFLPYPFACSQLRKHTSACFPRLELLENRINPAQFTWIGNMSSVWEEPNNWIGPAGQFPNTNNDDVIFDGNQSNVNVQLGSIMGGQPITIHSMSWSNNYSGEIQLLKNLTLQNGDSILDSAGKIAPQNVNANLILDDASLHVRRGWIGSTNNKSTVNVINDSLLDFNLQETVALGMNLIIGGVNGGTSSGLVRVRTDIAGPHMGRDLVVYNGADITVNPDSSLDLEGEDGAGHIIAVGQGPTGTVRVKGSVERLGSGEVRINMPFLVQNGGVILGDGPNPNPTLNINSNGNQTTNNYSLLVQSDGRVELRNGNTLRVGEEAVFDGGELRIRDFLANFRANQVIFTNNSELNLSYNETQLVSTLTFDLFGPAPEVYIQSGTWRFDAIGGGSNDRVTILGGELRISNDNSTLVVKGHNNPQRPNQFTIVVGNINGNFGAFAQLIYPTTQFFRIPPFNRSITLSPIQPGAGGMAWRDTNGNGIQEVGELPLAGVTVTLYTDDQTYVADTVTNSYGRYWFSDLDPGDYYIEITNPSGFDFTLQNQGSDPTLDSDVGDDPYDLNTYGKTPVFEISTSQVLDYLDVGLVVADTQDQVPILTDDSYTILRDQTLTTYTNQSEYGVLDNDYDDGTITVVAVDGMTIAIGTPFPLASGASLTMNADGTFVYIPVPGFAGQDSFMYTVDDGLHLETATVYIEVVPTATIGNFVWEDLDGNGLQDTAEPGIAGVMVYLHDSQFTQIDSAVTDSNGNYLFTSLPPGTYYVFFILPVDYWPTLVDAGTDDSLDNDFGPYGYEYITVSLSGSDNVSIDAGLFRKVTLSGRAWQDDDQDGIQDAGEVGLAGLYVALLDENGFTVAATSTGSDGYYYFFDVAPGRYRIVISPPQDYVFTLQNQGSDDTLDSDADPSGTIYLEALEAVFSGQDKDHLDAGLYSTI